MADAKSEADLQDTSQSSDLCPMCGNKLRLRHLNIQESIITCRKETCLFPFAEADISKFIVPFPYQSILPPSFFQILQPTNESAISSTPQGQASGSKSKKRRVNSKSSSNQLSHTKKSEDGFIDSQKTADASESNIQTSNSIRVEKKSQSNQGQSAPDSIYSTTIDLLDPFQSFHGDVEIHHEHNAQRLDDSIDFGGFGEHLNESQVDESRHLIEGADSNGISIVALGALDSLDSIHDEPETSEHPLDNLFD
eukprot:TRINITY_DN20738_c0_g1_i1.p1 TRINITY_DN20738_c0_g1~~TRINITY_DN20738_c0_g1_i1.p1  ORF type:complete len:252 (-),score=66.15 TRINITY_DN20738_c0_g1_i1:210-965(-)